MNRWQRYQQWRQLRQRELRARGKFSFVVWTGILHWGLPAGMLTILTLEVVQPLLSGDMLPAASYFKSSEFVAIVLIRLSVWTALGSLFGLWIWSRSGSDTPARRTKC